MSMRLPAQNTHGFEFWNRAGSRKTHTVCNKSNSGLCWLRGNRKSCGLFLSHHFKKCLPACALSTSALAFNGLVPASLVLRCSVRKAATQHAMGCCSFWRLRWWIHGRLLLKLTTRIHDQWVIDLVAIHAVNWTLPHGWLHYVFPHRRRQTCKPTSSQHPREPWGLPWTLTMEVVHKVVGYEPHHSGFNTGLLVKNLITTPQNSSQC